MVHLTDSMRRWLLDASATLRQVVHLAGREIWNRKYDDVLKDLLRTTAIAAVFYFVVFDPAKFGPALLSYVLGLIAVFIVRLMPHWAPSWYARRQYSDLYTPQGKQETYVWAISLERARLCRLLESYARAEIDARPLRDAEFSALADWGVSSFASNDLIGPVLPFEGEPAASDLLSKSLIRLDRTRVFTAEDRQELLVKHQEATLDTLRRLRWGSDRAMAITQSYVRAAEDALQRIDQHIDGLRLGTDQPGPVGHYLVEPVSQSPYLVGIDPMRFPKGL